MTPKSATFLHFEKHYKLKIMPEQYPFKPCRITEIKDTSKPSYVEYYVWDETSGILRRKRVVLTQPTKAERLKEAKIIVKEINAHLQSGLVVNPKSKPKPKIVAESTVIDVVDSYLNYISQTLSEKTFQSYKTELKRFTKFIKKENFDAMKFTEFDIVLAIDFLEDMVINQKLSNRSRNNARNTVGTMFNYYRKKKVIQDNPFEEISNLKTVAKRHAALGVKHAKQMKEICLRDGENQLLLYIYFIYYCFIRSGRELKELKVGDIKENTIFIGGETAKNDIGEHIKIPSVFNKIIDEYGLRSYPDNFYVFSENGNPGETKIKRDFMYEKHKKLLKKLNLHEKDYTIYSWKHTGVITLWKATNQDLEIIREHCRHRDLIATTKYLRDIGLFTDYSKINMMPEL
jgi:integrase